MAKGGAPGGGAVAAGRRYYELRATCDEYLAFHYPAEDPLAAFLGAGAPPLDERYPFAVRRLWQPRPGGRALDVGAACGRVTFALARDHRVAWGIDVSAMLVAAAREVQKAGRARYKAAVEGALHRDCDVPVEAPRNARFAVADAMVLPFADGAFDTVVGLNLVDRVPDPRRALDELERVTAPGGLLIVGSPYTWKEEFTPRERWLGGFRRGETPGRGGAEVRAHLSARFAREGERDLVFFIPHHARSGQLGLAHIQIFRRQT